MINRENYDDLAWPVLYTVIHVYPLLYAEGRTWHNPGWLDVGLCFAFTAEKMQHLTHTDPVKEATV